VNWSPGLSIDKKGYIGLGNFNGDNDFHNRVTICGLDSSVQGPHMLFTTLSNAPTMQIRNWSTNDISISFDSYVSSSNNIWTSSNTSNAVYKIHKHMQKLVFYSACNILSDWFPAISINSNGYIGMGTLNPSKHLTIRGVEPHMSFEFMNTPAYPPFQIINLNYNNINASFGAFWDGFNWKSSAPDSCYKIGKVENRFAIQSSHSSETISSWIDAVSIIQNGHLGIRTSNPEYEVDVHGQVFFRSNVYYDAHAIPAVSEVYNLGSSDNRWNNLFIQNTVNIDSLILKKDTASGGLKVFDNRGNSIARVWVKEILVGDPMNALNSNAVLITATSTGLNFTNVSPEAVLSNQDPISIVPYLYQNSNNFGLGVQDPVESLAILDKFSMSNYGKFIIYTSNNRLGFNIPASSETLTISGNMSLSNQSGKIALHTSNNNLGVGLSNPRARLQIAGDLLAGYSHVGTNNSNTGGPFFYHKPWSSTALNTHTIPYPQYCFGDNSAGNLYIQVGNKSSKIANVHLSFLKRTNELVDLFTVMLHKSATMSNLSITSSSNDIIVNTDNDCVIAWTTIGSY
jgi:hypothetical protein